MSADLITREDLLAAARELPPCETIHISKLGKSVCIQGLTGKQRDKWEESLIRGRGKHRKVVADNIRAKLAVQCIVNSPEDRRRVYSDEDAAMIGNLSAAILAPIYDKCQELSGTSDADLDELGNVSAEADGSGSPTN